ncbi:CASP C terminal-domain-containing protein [Mucidula mucida]|nr:CASP C terminal-domain-containing protein [Mucidula mucida]
MTTAETNFSGALATWRDVNLTDLQKTLDAQGVEVIDNQKANLVGRKGLSDKTKEFKRLSDDDKVPAIKGLLKAYQTEIDALTKRSRMAENAFLDLYKVLAEAPDPYPLLEAAVDQTVKIAEARDLEHELQRYREENAELKKRVSETSNIEAAKKKMEDMINDRVSQKENELNATYDERLRNYEERLESNWSQLLALNFYREQDLQRQVSLTKSQLRELRMSNEDSQAKLVNHSSKQDQEVVAKLAEVDMMVADLEFANSRVANVERRNEVLRAELEAMRSGAESSDRTNELQVKVAEYEAEVERMAGVLETQKMAMLELEHTAKKSKDDMTREIQKKVAEIDTLKHRLKQYSDYDEIKRELGIMKYVEFAGFDEDIDEDGDQIRGYEVGVQLPNPNAEKAHEQQGKSLEALLATKNKRLLEELTKFRILHSELETSLQAAQDRLSSTANELEKQRDLNEKLENDLLSMNKHGVNGDSIPSESSDVLAGLDLGKKSDSTSVRTTPIPFTSSADTSILPIVTSQRDRFRQRNAELEEELRKQAQIISDIRAEVKNLQSDNLKLYEKVRYMQSYREEAGTRPVTSQLDPLPAPSRSDDMSKYQARYEAAMNPFEAFRGREATRAYQNLNAIERGVLTDILIFYALALHLLVMFTSYECTSSSTQLEKAPYRS